MPESWVDRFESIGRYQSNEGKRAPYKTLLLLWLIGRIANGGDPQASFDDVRGELKDLLSDFRTGKSDPKPEHPFVYLGTTREIWQVSDRQGRDIAKMSDPVDETRSVPAREDVSYLRDQATGRISPEFMQDIEDEETRIAMVGYLLAHEFPESSHDSVLASVGLLEFMRQQPDIQDAPQRDPEFRENVLLAYERRCSFCNYGAILRDKPVGLDAAHLRMHSKGGPDSIENGVALCVQHHRLVDRGALGLTMSRGERKILVSQHLDILQDSSSRELLALSGQPMRPPQAGYDPPAKDHIEWHNEYLFQHPARQ